MNISLRILPLLAALGVLGLQSSLAETHADVVRSAAVTYADLDLSKPAGINTFYRRIQQAARKVCKSRDLQLYLQVQRTRDDCYQLTVADAVARMGSPMLTGLHRSEAGDATRGLLSSRRRRE